MGLLAQIESGVAEKVLACIGKRQPPCAAAGNPTGAQDGGPAGGYVRVCSTGQAYHHMKPLLAADLIQEEGRGV